MQERRLCNVIKARISEENPLIQVIIGPRQVGKITALKQAIESNSLYFSADGPIPPTFKDVTDWWNQAKESKDKILAVDEVQKIPNWSEIIKKLWDEDQSIKVVLTGSSSLLMEKGLTESLAGRYELIKAEHWNLSEAKKIFKITIKDYITYGCYPGSIRFIQDKARWSDYIKNSIIEPVISKDLLQLAPVKSPALLRQLFFIACSYPAQVISLNKLFGELNEKGSMPTLKNYMKLLSDSFLISSIEKYSTRKIKTKVSIPKIIVHDNGLLRSLEKLEGKDFKGLFHFCKKFPEFSPKLISLNNQEIEGIETLLVETVLSLARKY